MPPPATVRVPVTFGLKVKVPPAFVTAMVDVRPFVVFEVVASVIAPVCAEPEDCCTESTPVFDIVSAVPPTSAPGVPVKETPVPAETDDVPID